MYEAPRSASLLALEKSTLFVLSRAEFHNTVSELVEDQYKQNRQFIEKVDIFSLNH